MYWNAARKRWVLVDAQLDELQCNKRRSASFDMHGLWFVRGNLVRDVASLNKMGLLPWDGWGIIEARDEAISADDLALLDRVAELTSSDVPGFDRVRLLYESGHRLRVPTTIRS